MRLSRWYLKAVRQQRSAEEKIEKSFRGQASASGGARLSGRQSVQVRDTDLKESSAKTLATVAYALAVPTA